MKKIKNLLTPALGLMLLATINAGGEQTAPNEEAPLYAPDEEYQFTHKQNSFKNLYIHEMRYGGIPGILPVCEIMSQYEKNLSDDISKEQNSPRISVSYSLAELCSELISVLEERAHYLTQEGNIISVKYKKRQEFDKSFWHMMKMAERMPIVEEQTKGKLDKESLSRRRWFAAQAKSDLNKILRLLDEEFLMYHPEDQPKNPNAPEVGPLCEDEPEAENCIKF